MAQCQKDTLAIGLLTFTGSGKLNWYVHLLVLVQCK